MISRDTRLCCTSQEKTRLQAEARRQVARVEREGEARLTAALEKGLKERRDMHAQESFPPLSPPFSP